MSIYPKSSLRILRMLMHLSSDFEPRDFTTGEILTPEIPPSNRTYGAGQTHIGLCPKYLVWF